MVEYGNNPRHDHHQYGNCNDDQWRKHEFEDTVEHHQYREQDAHDRKYREGHPNPVIHAEEINLGQKAGRRIFHDIEHRNRDAQSLPKVVPKCLHGDVPFQFA